MALTAPSRRSMSAFRPPCPPWRTQWRPETLHAVVASSAIVLFTLASLAGGFAVMLLLGAGHARHVLPAHALHAGGAGLLRGAHRPGLPAVRGRRRPGLRRARATYARRTARPGRHHGRDDPVRRRTGLVRDDADPVSN